MPRVICSVLLATVTATPLAAPLAPKDFAYGLPVDVDGRSAVYEISLPADIYEAAVRADLGDLRVFNRDGEAVPHVLRRPASKRTRAETVPVPLFPLYTTDSGADVEITTGEDGSIVEIAGQGGALLAENAEIRRYIVDLSGIKHRIEALEFDLLGLSTGFINAVTVEHSEDLTEWSTLVRESTVTYLNFGGHLLRQDAVDLQGPVRRYLRLAWQQPPGGVQIGTVRVRLEPEKEQGGHAWLSPAGVRDERDAGVFLYDSGGVFPVARLNLGLPQSNSVFTAEIASRPDASARWRRIHSGAFYDLNVQDFGVRNPPVSIGTNTDRYWRVTVRGEEGIGAHVPQLALGWRAATLLFVARGSGPFTVAFGSAVAEPAGEPVQTLLSILNEDEQGLLISGGKVRDVVVLGGEAALAERIRVDGRKAVLWAVLVVAVLALGWMAWDLMRQMRRGTAADE